MSSTTLTFGDSGEPEIRRKITIQCLFPRRKKTLQWPYRNTLVPHALSNCSFQINNLNLFWGNNCQWLFIISMFKWVTRPALWNDDAETQFLQFWTMEEKGQRCIELFSLELFGKSICIYYIYYIYYLFYIYYMFYMLYMFYILYMFCILYIYYIIYIIYILYILYILYIQYITVYPCNCCMCSSFMYSCFVGTAAKTSISV